MPNRDRTGNTGRGLGRGAGAGRGQGGLGRGRGLAGGRPLGSDVCTCPKCGHQIPHAQRGVPCTQIKCPKCQTLMQGEYC